MPVRSTKALLVVVLLPVLGVIAYFLITSGGDSLSEESGERIAAVQVAAVTRRPLDLQRTFSGALEAQSKVVVAPKVSGRIQRVMVDLGDTVERGQTIAFLDDAEFAQAVKQAEAELAVAEANQVQAQNTLDISRRENERVVTLRERGIASDSEYDIVRAELLVKEAQLKAAEAQVNRAEAALESARIRYGYTRVTADWIEDDSHRRVAERYIDDGETVSANEPLLLIVKLDPIVAAIAVTERDYGRLQVGQQAGFRTDAFPEEVFPGRIARIAPVFRESSRQARIEFALANPERRLKPGMFVRATVTLDHVEDAVAVPDSALTSRGDVEGVFHVNEAGDRVAWVPVRTGIRSGGWVQLLDLRLSGRVVTLGQHLIDDGSPIRIADTLEPESLP